MTSLADTVGAWLRRGTPGDPYLERSVGSYRALCRPLAEGRLVLLLLAGEDGAVYVPRDGGGGPDGRGTEVDEVVQVLRHQRLRPTTTTLALRLPAEIAGGAGSARFTLWASPAYLAARGDADILWK